MEFPTSPSLTAQEKFPKCCVDYTAQHFSRWTFPEGSSALTKCHSLICQNLKLLCCIKYKHSEDLNNNRNCCSSHFSNVHIYFMNCYWLNFFFVSSPLYAEFSYKHFSPHCYKPNHIYSIMKLWYWQNVFITAFSCSFLCRVGLSLRLLYEMLQGKYRERGKRKKENKKIYVVQSNSKY